MSAPNFLQTLLIALITEAETVVPIFLHSKNAMAAFNLSEPIFNGTLSAVLASQQAVTAPIPDPAPATDPTANVVQMPAVHGTAAPATS